MLSRSRASPLPKRWPRHSNWRCRQPRWHRKAAPPKPRTLYKRSLTVVEEALPNDPLLAGSLNNFGQFYRGQRRYLEAADLFRRALAIYGQSYGDNHRLTATVINNLAAVYLAAGKYDDAGLLYARGLGATEKLFGAEHYSVAISLDWLAQTNFLQKRYSESRQASDAPLPSRRNQQDRNQIWPCCCWTTSFPL